MATEVLMPKLGLTMTEGTIEEWRIKEGQPVKKGEVLFSVATDKLTNDVEVAQKENGIREDIACRLTSFSRSLQTFLRIILDSTWILATPMALNKKAVPEQKSWSTRISPVTPTFDLAFDSAVSPSEAASCFRDLSRASMRCAAAPRSQAAVYLPRRDISASG